MNRRSYLAAITSATAAAAVAGCVSDSDNGPSSNGGSGGISVDDVELVEHSMNQVEDEMSTESVYVEGKVRNTGDVEMGRIELSMQFYTSDGDQADSGTTAVYDVAPGETALFDSYYSGPADLTEITDYDIEVSSAGP